MVQSNHFHCLFSASCPFGLSKWLSSLTQYLWSWPTIFFCLTFIVLLKIHGCLFLVNAYVRLSVADVSYPVTYAAYQGWCLKSSSIDRIKMKQLSMWYCQSSSSCGMVGGTGKHVSPQIPIFHVTHQSCCCAIPMPFCQAKNFSFSLLLLFLHPVFPCCHKIFYLSSSYYMPNKPWLSPL